MAGLGRRLLVGAPAFGRHGSGPWIITEPVPQAVASALEGDDLGVVKEADEDGRGVFQASDRRAARDRHPLNGTEAPGTGRLRDGLRRGEKIASAGGG